MPAAVEPRATGEEGPSLLARAAIALGSLLANGALMGIGSVVGAQATLRINAHREPHPLPHQMATLLDHPLRLRYRNPGETLGLFGLTAGMTVLDLGCGTGLFAEEAARMVGPTGRVHAVDIQAPMLDAARARIAAAGFSDRVLFHHAGAYALPLENLSVDVALLVALLGEVPDRLHALLEVYRVLKPGGRLAVGEELPHPAYVGPRTLRSLAEEAGFTFVARTGGPLAYNAVFVRPTA
jgi:SAM-dependent methyltransferase